VYSCDLSFDSASKAEAAKYRDAHLKSVEKERKGLKTIHALSRKKERLQLERPAGLGSRILFGDDEVATYNKGSPPSNVYKSPGKPIQSILKEDRRYSKEMMEQDKVRTALFLDNDRSEEERRRSSSGEDISYRSEEERRRSSEEDLSAGDEDEPFSDAELATMGASTNVNLAPPTNVIPTNDNLMSLAPQMPDVDEDVSPQAGDGLTGTYRDPPGNDSDNTSESETEEHVVQGMQRLSLDGGNSQVTRGTKLRKSKRLQGYSP